MSLKYFLFNVTHFNITHGNPNADVVIWPNMATGHKLIHKFITDEKWMGFSPDVKITPTSIMNYFYTYVDGNTKLWITFICWQKKKLIPLVEHKLFLIKHFLKNKATQPIKQKKNYNSIGGYNNEKVSLIMGIITFLIAVTIEVL